MKHITIIATALLLLSSFGAQARTKAVLEDGREASASMLTLPSALNGVLSIQGCTACKLVTLTLSNSAQFYIGTQEVSFVDFKRFLSANPKSNVLVVSPANQQVVSRMRASPPDVK
ncbi:MAG: hypothetical protein ABI821_14565 [Pseudomonadota bacterium]